MDSVRETERDSETEQDSDRQRVKGRERRRDRVNEREQMRKNIISNIICSSVGDRPTKYKPRHSHSTQFLFVCFLFKLQTNKQKRRTFAGLYYGFLEVLVVGQKELRHYQTLSI